MQGAGECFLAQLAICKLTAAPNFRLRTSYASPYAISHAAIWSERGGVDRPYAFLPRLPECKNPKALTYRALSTASESSGVYTFRIAALTIPELRLVL